MKKLIITIFFLSNLSSQVVANIDSLAFVRLNQQVQQLEDSLNIYKGKILNYEVINNGAKLVKSFIENPIESLLIYGGILVAAVAGLFSLFFWILRKTNPKWFTTIIQKWVERYEEINVLKRDKEILILSANERFSNEKFIKKLFDRRHFKFEKVTYTSFEKVREKLAEKDYHIIFANNEDKKLNQNDLENIISDYQYTVLFYYGKPSSWDFKKYGENEPAYLERLNFANSRAQIYGNLISSMKFHDTLI